MSDHLSYRLKYLVSVALRNKVLCQCDRLHKYSGTVQAESYAQVFNYVTIYVFMQTIKTALLIINVRVDVIQGKNRIVKNWTNF